MSSVDGATRRRGYLLEILLVSFAALLMEISYTRIVSFKLFYYYTYLIIGLALLGTGCGGVAVVVSRRLRTAETGTIVMWSAIVGAVSVLVGYCIIALTPIDTLAVWEYEAGATAMNVGRLLVICLSLFAAFLPIGVVIALLLSRGSDEIGRLYFADLLGASLACAVVVFMLNWVGPTTAIMVAGAVLAAVGLKLAITASSRWTPVAVGALALLSVAAVFPTLLPEISTDTTKTVAAADIDHSAWSALFRVDAEPLEDQILLHHDGLIGSAIHEYNGDLTTLSRFDSDPRSIPFAALGNSPEEALIIGAAGGNEILASLYYGSRHTDAVELNPVTHGLVTDRYADFAGNIADNEAVNYVWGEGRSFLARSDKEYDLIWFPAPDSYSANAASSAFVLSENYLYTREAIEESLGHLADDGMIAFHYGEFDFEEAPNRTARYTATAREALGSLGSEDPTAHIIVTSAPVLFDGGGMTLSTVLVKESPFTDEEIDRVEEGLPAVDGSIMRYAAGRAVEPNVISEMLETPADEVDEWFDAQATDVSPIDDDAPFFWHFNRFSDVISDFGEPIDRGSPENAVGERVLLLLLGVVIVLASVFLLLPFFAIRETWRALPRKASSASYFACLGVGFIFFEIVLIQRLTLYLGYPTYSLTVTLASILVFTGVGAYLSGKVDPVRERVVPALLIAVVTLTLFFQYVLVKITDGTLDWPLVWRMAIVFALLAPLGMCLGMFMPLGIGAVSRLTPHSNEYVAWGWAVNGFASVIGAVLSTILAMMFGFRGVLFFSLGAYCVALAVLYSLLRPYESSPDEELVAPTEDLGDLAEVGAT